MPPDCTYTGMTEQQADALADLPGIVRSKIAEWTVHPFSGVLSGETFEKYPDKITVFVHRDGETTSVPRGALNRRDADTVNDSETLTHTMVLAAIKRETSLVETLDYADEAERVGASAIARQLRVVVRDRLAGS